MTGSVAYSVVRFSGSLQPRVMIVPAPVPVAGKWASTAVRLAFDVALPFLSSNAALIVTVGVPEMRAGSVSGFMR